MNVILGSGGWGEPAHLAVDRLLGGDVETVVLGVLEAARVVIRSS